MKKIILFLIGTLIINNLFSQDSLTKYYWTYETAYTFPKHSCEAGLLTGTRYGINDKIELSAHPLRFILIPQMNIKVGWCECSGIQLATEHGILYPTLFMRTIARKGSGGLISPEFTIPDMFAIDNRILASYKPFKNVILTAHVGISFSVKFDKLDSRSSIDLPVIYPRLAVFYNQPVFDMGIDLRGKFSQRFGWLFNVGNFIISNTTHNYFLENKGILAYTSKKQKLRIEAGYKLCYGKYPAGTQWHLLPMIDLIFRIRK